MILELSYVWNMGQSLSMFEKEKEIILSAMEDFRFKGGKVVNNSTVSKDGTCMCPLACVGRFNGVESNDSLLLAGKAMKILNWTFDQAISFMHGVDDYNESITSKIDDNRIYFNFGKEILKEI